MHLYQSNSQYPWNTTFTTEEGQVIYKTESPLSIKPIPITIKRIIPPNVDEKTSSDDALRDSFFHLAEIDYHIISKSHIRYNGIAMDGSEFLWKPEERPFLRKSQYRIFRGPDGKEYEWHLGETKCKLYLKDPSKILVASFHQQKFGIIGDARPASLEIFSEGLHMIDLIFVTFIFAERIRVDQNQYSPQAWD